LAGQALIVILHAARAGGTPRSRQDIKAAWDEAPPGRREEVAALVDALQAQIAFAAATGHLEDFRTAREYQLWSVASSGGTRFQEWKARVKAAPSRRAALRLAVRATLVNTDHLAMVRGHRPTKPEIVLEFFARPARGVKESLLGRGGRRAGGDA
jgi:hypothetical protein